MLTYLLTYFACSFCSRPYSQLLFPRAVSRCMDAGIIFSLQMVEAVHYSQVSCPMALSAKYTGWQSLAELHWVISHFLAWLFPGCIAHTTGRFVRIPRSRQFFTQCHGAGHLWIVYSFNHLKTIKCKSEWLVILRFPKSTVLWLVRVSFSSTLAQWRG